MEHFASVLRPRGQRPGADLTLTSPGEAEKARRFHSGLPGYAPTPLVSLDGLAHSLGVSKIWIKDESKRFGLNAFKALGGSYAMARCLSEKLGKPLEEMSFEELCAPAARRALGDITFVTATDGNHGRGVAWAARLLGQKAVVYMPKGSAAERLENIRAQGAQAEITEYNYDDAVRLANRMAEEHGWILIQDTAWPGYEEIPAHIMQGYTTLAAETLQQLEEQGAERPTHLFLQAGVGSFYMPKGSAAERLENIRAQGAQAEITEYNYDDAVRLANRMAEEHGWILIQDTAWPGYEEIPAHIMQGYTTLAAETLQQLEERPTHLFLQAGVGSFAGAALGFFTSVWGEERPVTAIVEPDRADCLFRTAQADDGALHFVTGDMDSMMAGLCCGEPCTISWKIIDAYADAFLSCGDGYAARGMRLLARPEEGDPAVVSGESGAVTAGVLDALMRGDAPSEVRQALGLNESSRVLLVSTEGDTDQENYQRIINGED